VADTNIKTIMPSVSVEEDGDIALPADYEQLVAEQSSSPRENAHSLILGQAALHGLAGRIVWKLEPETEAHPAAMLIEILMNFGSIIGRTAHYEVEDMKHYGNINAVRVGQTSKGRKGTAGARINRIFKDVDPGWFVERRVSGLSSGEGLVHQVRDDVYNEDGDRIVEKGVADKRLLVREGEFAQALAVMQRQGNTLSPTIRNAWDGLALGSLVRSSQLAATDAHISILGDITQEELNFMLSHADTFNGFANRFFWVLTERNGVKPFGGEELEWKQEIEELKKAAEFARKQKRVFMDHNARRMWARVYPKLSEGHSGQFGAATSRAEAQVVRLALLYALLDQSEYIRSEHLAAALTFWRYCEESARLIFGALTPEQQKIVAALERKPLTQGAIRRQVFSDHRPSGAVALDLAKLQGLKLVELVPDNRGVELYRLTAR